METNQNKSVKIQLDFKDSKYATGRRKTSIAKIWLKKGSGKIYVNGKNYEDYFKRPNHKMLLIKPFEIINQHTDYDVKCKVKGGGLSGQVYLDATSEEVFNSEDLLVSRFVKGEADLKKEVM